MARAGKVGKGKKVKMPSSFTITEKNGLSVRNKKGTIEKSQPQLVSTEELLAQLVRSPFEGAQRVML